MNLSKKYKIAAAVLLIISLAVAAVSFPAVFLLERAGAYRTDRLSDTQFADELIDFDLCSLMNPSLYSDTYTKQWFKNCFSSEYCPLVITVETPSGTVLLNNYKTKTSTTAVEKYTLTIGYYEPQAQWLFDATEGHDNPKPELSMVCFVSPSQKLITFSEWMESETGLKLSGLSESEVYDLYARSYFEHFTEANSTHTLSVIPSDYYNVTVARAERTIAPLSREHLICLAFENRTLLLYAAAISGMAVVLTAYLLIPRRKNPKSKLPETVSAIIRSILWASANAFLISRLPQNRETGAIFLVILNFAVITAFVSDCAKWRKVRKAAAQIADGNTDIVIPSSGLPSSLRAHTEDLSRIKDGVVSAVDKLMSSERMKTDLITNVSHDLKTPLTSIVSYVGLLKAQPIENETAKEYINTLDRQAGRLGRLIEDLVEASKITSGSIAVYPTELNIAELLEQAVSEYEFRFSQCELTPVLSTQSGDMTAFADGRLLWRVFDNLLSNACKYSPSGSRLYIDADCDSDSVNITFRNISAQPLNIPPEELMERFVRGDSSRSTPGSGLGLTIAKSLVELQGGTFTIEIDGDLFKAVIRFPAVSQ
ncbi:MAG: sensor histidine kinase [Clostridia bacterium]|nr:sensor histidine kinase [Clostridia bacterium]